MKAATVKYSSVGERLTAQMNRAVSRSPTLLYFTVAAFMLHSLSPNL